jgi:hypothetical protein
VSTFVTIKKRSGQCHLTAPANLLSGEQAKQQGNEIDKDVQLVPVYLDNEGFAADLHSVVSFPPSELLLRGLIALGATCAQGSRKALSATSQPVTPKRKRLLLHSIAICVAATVTFIAGCYNVVIINMGIATRQTTPLAPGVQCVPLQKTQRAIKACEDELKREAGEKPKP